MLCTSLEKSHEPHLHVLQGIQRLLQCAPLPMLPVSTSFNMAGVLPNPLGVRAWVCVHLPCATHTLQDFSKYWCIKAGFHCYFQTFHKGFLSCFCRHNVLTQDIVMVEVFSDHFAPKIWKAHLSFALIKVSYCLWNTLCIQNAQRSVNHWHRRCSKCCECCMLAKVSSAHEICSRSSGYNFCWIIFLLIFDRVLCCCVQQERRWYLFT